MRILLIEEDTDTNFAIRSKIENHYVVDTANDAQDGAYLSQSYEYDAIVLNNFTSAFDIKKVCSHTKEVNTITPILYLGSNNSKFKSFESLEYGADDYANLPLETDELLTKVKAMIKLSQKGYGCFLEKLPEANLEIDTFAKNIKRYGKTISLRRKEYELFEYLFINKGRVLSKEKILIHVWKNSNEVISNTVEVHIKSLRDKLDKPFGSKLIKTVSGFGYKFCPD